MPCTTDASASERRRASPRYNDRRWLTDSSRSGCFEPAWRSRAWCEWVSSSPDRRWRCVDVVELPEIGGLHRPTGLRFGGRWRRSALANARIRPWRLAVPACENHEVAVRVAQPELAMGGAAGTVRWIAMRRQDDFRAKRVSAPNGGVEVLDLEPERQSVSVRARGGVADAAVMVFDVECMELQHQGPAAQQTLVLLAAVSALTAEELLVEATA